MIHASPLRHWRYRPRCPVIPAAFHGQVDHVQIVKIYGGQTDGPGTRDSPASILDVRMHSVYGYPGSEPGLHVPDRTAEPQYPHGGTAADPANHAFSKKWENHEYHLAWHFLYHNFCWVHTTLKATSAVAAALWEEKWSVERLLDEMPA